jgi:FkbH-like protein
MKQEDKRNTLNEVKTLTKKGAHQEAFTILKATADPYDDFVLQTRYAKIFKSLDNNALELRKIRIAILGSNSLEHFSDIFSFWLALEGFNLELYLAPFNTIRQTILDGESELYRFKPDVVWLFTTHRDVIIEAEHEHSLETINQNVQAVIDEYINLWKTIQSRMSAFIIQNNADLPAERVFGNMEGSTAWGKATLLRQFNVKLASMQPPGVIVFDLDHVSSLFGRGRWCDMRYWFHSKHAFSLEAIGLVSFYGAKLICALKGSAKKCIVLDLDNTLWGGVIGDDGLDGIRLGNGADGEAFAAFQEYLRDLNKRGIILAVCSKNEEDNAKEPFLNHPDMRLKMDNIAVFRANWKNKADNIHDIADTLNIGLDSMVFLDDNPVERELVRSMLPMVMVPELTDDPADYITILDRLCAFETVSFSEEDKIRARMYKDNAQRKELQNNFSDISEYLKSLDMEATEGVVDDFHIKRMSQLINKSNQFHLTGTRYTVSELEGLNADSNCVVRYFNLKDRFGDNGLISVIVMKCDGETLLIDTWVMSCRVLSRGMEEFICLAMISIAKDRGCKKILGRYVPSKKNQLVAGLYEKLGFEKCREDENHTSYWELSLQDGNPEYTVYIRSI